MLKKSEEVNKRIKALGVEIKAIYDEHKENPTGDALEAVKTKRAEMDRLHKEEYLPAKSWEEGIDASEEHLKRIKEPQRQGGGDFAKTADGRPMVKTIADMVLEDEGFKSWFTEKASQGGPQGHFKSPSVSGISLKTLVGSATLGATIRTDYDADVPLPFRPLNVRNLVTIGTTESDLITYTQQTVRTNNAAITPEATATAGSSGTSPESGLGYVAATAAVQDITTWVPATRQALADAGQLKGIIDDELTQMIAVAFENTLVAKILATTGILVQPFVTDKLTTTRKAITKSVYTGLSDPNAFLLNPQDWEDIELTKDAQGRYYLGGPANQADPRLWSRAVTQNVQMPQYTGITGDLKTVKVWDRQQTQIYSTDSHADFFIRSISVVLGVFRAAIGVRRPAALTEFQLQ